MEHFSYTQFLTQYLIIIISLVFAIKLSLAQIPAKIAAKKGYSIVGFLFFGIFFFLVALVVSLFLPDKLATKSQTIVCQNCLAENGSLFNKLTDLKKAHDSDLITDTEYERKRNDYLNSF